MQVQGFQRHQGQSPQAQSKATSSTRGHSWVSGPTSRAGSSFTSEVAYTLSHKVDLWDKPSERWSAVSHDRSDWQLLGSREQPESSPASHTGYVAGGQCPGAGRKGCLAFWWMLTHGSCNLFAALHKCSGSPGGGRKGPPGWPRSVGRPGHFVVTDNRSRQPVLLGPWGL